MKMNPYCRFKAEDLHAFIQGATSERVADSLAKTEPTFTDFLHFLSPAAREFMPQMIAVATGVRRRCFGRTVRLFAPQDGKKEFEGTLTAADDEKITLRVRSKDYTIERTAIALARPHVSFESEELDS